MKANTASWPARGPNSPTDRLRSTLVPKGGSAKMPTRNANGPWKPIATNTNQPPRSHTLIAVTSTGEDITAASPRTYDERIRGTEDGPAARGANTDPRSPG